MQPMVFEVKIKVKDMYAYLMYHAYKGSGMIGILLSLIAAVMAFTVDRNANDGRFVILVFVALLFTVIQPVMLFFKALQQIAGNPFFQKPLTYTFTEEEFITSQEETSLSVSYDDIWNIKIFKKRIFIYTGRLVASIFPLRDLNQEEKDRLLAFLNEKKEEKRKRKDGERK